MKLPVSTEILGAAPLTGWVALNSFVVQYGTLLTFAINILVGVLVAGATLYWRRKEHRRIMGESNG